MNNEEINYQLIKYEDGDFSLEVYQLDADKTIWLSTNQMGKLFDKSLRTTRDYIKKMPLLYEQRSNNAHFLEEQRQNNGNNNGNEKVRYFRVEGVKQIVAAYSIEVVEYIGKRIRSNRLDAFLKWVSGLNINTNISAINSEKTYELVRFKDGDFSLDVSVSPDEDTVWLTQEDIALLFDVDRSRITRHISNIFEDFELDEKSNVRKTHFPFSDKMVNIYNLDVIMAVGYRVKSKRGILFRRWATSVLKEYLLKGHAINEERCLTCASNILSLQSKVEAIESKMKRVEDTLYPSTTKVIYEGEIIDAYTFFRKLFFLAKKEIIITDYYADKFLLSLLKDINVKITIYTSPASYLNKEVIPSNIKVVHSDIHGRYIFIDDFVYVLDTSFNDIGKHRFLIIKLENITKETILKDIKSDL